MAGILAELFRMTRKEVANKWIARGIGAYPDLVHDEPIVFVDGTYDEAEVILSETPDEILTAMRKVADDEWLRRGVLGYPHVDADKPLGFRDGNYEAEVSNGKGKIFSLKNIQTGYRRVFCAAYGCLTEPSQGYGICDDHLKKLQDARNKSLLNQDDKKTLIYVEYTRANCIQVKVAVREVVLDLDDLGINVP